MLLAISLAVGAFQGQIASHIVHGNCTGQSSHFNAQFDCSNALDGKLSTENEWASKGEGVGAYMTVQFTKRCTIDRIRLVQRVSHKELNREIQLCFEDGTCQLVSSSLLSGIISIILEIYIFLIIRL